MVKVHTEAWTTKEAWTKDTGKSVVKIAGQAIVVCGALALVGLTLGAVKPTLNF